LDYLLFLSVLVQCQQPAANLTAAGLAKAVATHSTLKDMRQARKAPQAQKLSR